MADFQNRLICRMCNPFSSSFGIFNFYFLIQTENFAKPITFAWAKAFARWPIFKIVSFIE